MNKHPPARSDRARLPADSQRLRHVRARCKCGNADYRTRISGKLGGCVASTVTHDRRLRAAGSRHALVNKVRPGAASLQSKSTI
jgi:hypothetical protein